MDTVTTQLHQSPLVVVCGSDDNYAMPLAVTLYSALIHLEEGCNLYLYIIDGGISQRNRQRIYRVLEIEHIDLHLKWVIPKDLTSLSGLKTHDWLTQAAYLRLLIPDLVPEHFEKAIYLDSDLQVEANLSNLWAQEMGSYALLAVRDLVVPYVSSNFGIVKYQELGFDPETPYFNSGVLVMNLQQWRTENISQKVIEYLRKYDKYVNGADQEGLNVVLFKKWGKLDIKWNVMSHIYNYEQWEESAFKEEIRSVREDLHNPYIFHFAGFSKPWKIGCEHPAQLQWIRYLQKSRWFEPHESILWFTKWFFFYYLWQIKVMLKKVMFKIGLRKAWEKLRAYAYN